MTDHTGTLTQVDLDGDHFDQPSGNGQPSFADRLAAKAAQDDLLVAARLGFAELEQIQKLRTFCEFCCEEAPRVHDTYVGDVQHKKDCAYFRLQQAILAVEGFQR